METCLLPGDVDIRFSAPSGTDARRGSGKNSKRKVSGTDQNAKGIFVIRPVKIKDD